MCGAAKGAYLFPSSRGLEYVKAKVLAGVGQYVYNMVLVQHRPKTPFGHYGLEGIISKVYTRVLGLKEPCADHSTVFALSDPV